MLSRLHLGLRDTVLVGAAVNAVVFATAAWVARTLPPARALAETATALARPLSRRVSLVLPLIALSGVTSFTYEVLWTKLLGHILGGSVYAFSTMLASFLVGIAGGSAVASRLATTAARAASGFCVAQLGIAVLSVAAFAIVNELPELARALGASAEPELLIDSLLSAAVLLPASLCIGATFPFAVRILARSDAQVPVLACFPHINSGSVEKVCQRHL